MNIKQYKALKEHELEAFRTEYIYVSPRTLFRKEEFKGLSEGECLSKAISLGWRWDINRGKYYKMN
ncbi:hypothetical protein NE686_17735 [Tissierella carlieri]|uniref:Uncharacterized protein n=1 Tax=Tissierella carlieri TaxID=689904 RepID=A0ABT1SER7_9FIRM|nr:hypothetical protein [Tissierella carlieri]MCQ4924946.1 hypothetical protein [Tissierella carlieri]